MARIVLGSYLVRFRWAAIFPGCCNGCADSRSSVTKSTSWKSFGRERKWCFVDFRASITLWAHTEPGKKKPPVRACGGLIGGERAAT
jgi:hypothetical protein